MSTPVTFNYAGWKARFPELKAVSEDAANMYFAEATLYWRNDGTSPNTTTTEQTIYLNMVTAHIAQLYSQTQGDPSPGAAKPGNSPVGRINSATQGSVTVQVEMAPPKNGTEAWFNQTKYGADFWAMTAAYRTFKYAVPGCNPVYLGSFGYRRW